MVGNYYLHNFHRRTIRVKACSSVRLSFLVLDCSLVGLVLSSEERFNDCSA